MFILAIMHSLTQPLSLCSQGPAWKRLTSHIFNMPERISLITEIFSDHNQVDAVGNLSGDDTQDFIDVIDEASTCTLSSLGGQVDRLPLKLLRSVD
jgi:hypothetical protein